MSVVKLQVATTHPTHPPLRPISAHHRPSQSLDKLAPPLDFLTSGTEERGVKGYTSEEVVALDAYRTQYAKYRLGEAEGAKGEKPTDQKVVVVANSSGGSLQESEAQVS